jgi:Na+-transporting NADH:ubiquinone oxidoreductase subunit D
MKSYKFRQVLKENIGINNPVFVQILGICSTLAVTNVLRNTVVMCAGLVFVTGLSNLTVSLLRKYMPGRVGMMVETLIIAAYVIIVDVVLKAYIPDISRQLGPYVGLIITNCIIMGRAEAFALSNPPGLSLVDGLSSGLGYSYVLLIIAFLRELLGSGSIWGYRVLGEWWTNWNIMIMAPGAFFMLALFIWVVKGNFMKEKKEQVSASAPAPQAAATGGKS